MVIRQHDVEKLRREYNTAEPFPWIHIPEFLENDVAAEVAAAMPSYEQSRSQGREFDFVNEVGKVQICDADKFPPPVRQLHDALSSREWLETLEEITQIPNLLADPELDGGGIHVTGPRGRLDVHIDFNFVESRALHRRLNILVYLNPKWEDAWGGAVELWDSSITKCHASILPKLNHCLVFETSGRSYHGVQPVTCPPGFERRSFAAYYYTKDPPADWDGSKHSTVFRARPDEKFRGAVLMPLEKAQRELRSTVQRAKGKIKRLIGRT